MPIVATLDAMERTDFRCGGDSVLEMTLVFQVAFVTRGLTLLLFIGKGVTRANWKEGGDLAEAGGLPCCFECVFGTNGRATMDMYNNVASPL